MGICTNKLKCMWGKQGMGRMEALTFVQLSYAHIKGFL